MEALQKIAIKGIKEKLIRRIMVGFGSLWGGRPVRANRPH